MIDSAARAERFDPPPSISPFYTWEVPQKPVSVRLPLLLIDRLERDAIESFRSVKSRGSEIGGVLWGSVQAGQPGVVSVAEYELVPCDYALGPLFHLAEADLARLDRALAQRGSSGLYPVGFFRSHTRKGLSLDSDDLAVMESRFNEPHQVALIVRPYATKASAAGIFIREAGSLHGEATCLEFPFRSAQLAPAKHLADAVEPPAPNAPAPPAAPKPIVRAQIVPIASRRDIGAVVPPLAAELAPPPAGQPAVAPVIQPAIQPAEQPAAKPLPPVAQPAIQGAAQPAAESREKAPAIDSPRKAAARKAPVEPSPAAIPNKPPARARGSKMLWFAVGAIFPLLLSGALFIYPGVFHRGTLPTALPGQDSSPLALRVERAGGEMLLTWNRDSAAIRNASHAVLSISDGQQHENVEMDLAQLRNGSIVYLPVTADVVFRMEVSGKDTTTTASESVRVLRTRPSPMPQDAPTDGKVPNSSAPGTQPAVPATAALVPTAATAGTPLPAAEEASGPSAPVKPFNTESLAARLRPVHTDISLPDAPAVSRSESVPVPDAALNLTAVTPAPLPPAPKKAEPAPAAAPPSVPVVRGGDIRPAQLIFRRDPVYPQIARDAGAQGAVELIATIGINGKVKNVKAVKGHPLLQKAAIDAVMQWQYKPTMLNGKPVETETSIKLNFMNDR